jgi:hypothetical protein
MAFVDSAQTGWHRSPQTFAARFMNAKNGRLLGAATRQLAVEDPVGIPVRLNGWGAERADQSQWS